MTRANLLHIALMSSENRAASALGRNYPGGITAFVDAMNAKARAAGHDAIRITSIPAACRAGMWPARATWPSWSWRRYQRSAAARVLDRRRKPSSKPAAARCSIAIPTTWWPLPDWDIGLQKTGFINEAGRCLMMQAVIQGRAVIMVFLDSKGKQSRTADAGRIAADRALPDRLDVDAIRPSTVLPARSWRAETGQASRLPCHSVASASVDNPGSTEIWLAVCTRSSSHSSCRRSAGAEIDRPAISLPRVVVDAGGHAAHAQFQLFVVARIAARAHQAQLALELAPDR